MSNEQKKAWHANLQVWLQNLYYVGTLLTLVFIMAQAIFARRSIVESSEWEKAKITIENIEHFKEKLKETALYGQTDVLLFADRGWPDFTTPEGFQSTDTLRKIYYSLFDGNDYAWREDFLYTLSIMDAFAYPIIMGYASESGSYQSVIREYSWYGNYIMPNAFHVFKPIGHHAKLLFRLWRVKSEILFLSNWDIELVKGNMDQLLFFEGTEVTPATLKQYEKKLSKELKKIEKEIVEFRKNSLK